jgi:type IV pilus assembly protein PilF
MSFEFLAPYKIRVDMKVIRNLGFLGLFLLASCQTPGNRREQADLYLRLGISHIEKGQFPQALKNLLESERLNPRNPVLHNAMGLTYFYRDRSDLAEESFLKALEINPNETESRNNYARMLIHQKRFQKAHEQLKVATADLTYAFPNKSYFNLGFLYFESGKYEQAIVALEKSLDLKSDDCTTATYYGRTFFELKRYASATAALERAVELCQPLMIDEPHYYQALALYRMGDVKKAADKFKETYSLFPEGKFHKKARAMIEVLKKANQ